MEPRSRRPKRVRQPQTPSEIAQRIQELREEHPRWGREKLRVLLEREGIHISARIIDRAIDEFPFPITAIQSDGGSEFLGMFSLAVENLKLVRYFNRPNYPKGNGRIERTFRTDEEEFYQVEDLPVDPGGLEAALQNWNQITYEQVRPHEALGYKTPEEFYQDWLKNHSVRKEVLSDMS